MKKLKNFINGCLRPFGFEIKRYKPYLSFEVSIAAWLKQNQVDAVLDVGANTGQYARFIRKSGYHGNIISFEPLSEAHEKLTANSRKDSNWHIAPRMAIGDFDGELEINISLNSQSSSLMLILPKHETAEPSSRYVRTEKTEVHTIDGLIGSIIPEDYRKLFLKIDVQGYEDKVLSGIEKNFCRIKAVQVELSTVPLYAGQKLYNEIIDYLVQKEFYLYAINPVFEDNATRRLLQFDGFFAKKNTAKEDNSIKRGENAR